MARLVFLSVAVIFPQYVFAQGVLLPPAPIPVTQGGTGCIVASIACINAISGGSLVGALVGTSDAQILTNKSIATSQLTGAISAAQMPALTGDVASSAGSVATTVIKINGASPATIATSGSASDLSAGTVAAARMPALTGDCTTSAGAVATTCTKTNGTSFGTGATANAGTGIGIAANSINSNANEHMSFQPGLITAIVNTKSVFAKFSRNSTVDNLEGSSQSLTCTGNPTVTMYECGTSSTCASPTTIGTVTVTAAGTVVDGTVSAPAIAAGDYVAFAISAGTCTALDISAVAQVHAN